MTTDYHVPGITQKKSENRMKLATIWHEVSLINSTIFQSATTIETPMKYLVTL